MSGAIVAAAVARARRRIASHFVEAKATTKTGAIAFAPGSSRLERRMFKRMVAFGAIKEEKGGLYWLDEKRLSDFKKESLARVLSILAVAGFAVAGAMAISG